MSLRRFNALAEQKVQIFSYISLLLLFFQFFNYSYKKLLYLLKSAKIGRLRAVVSALFLLFIRSLSALKIEISDPAGVLLSKAFRSERTK